MLDIAGVEQAVASVLASARIPGLALSIVTADDTVYMRGFGVNSIEDDACLVTPETIFPLASLSKPLTGMAIMRLVDAGALDLDQPVTSYVPWFRLRSDQEAAEQVTLRMLLSHTAGLPDDWSPTGPRDARGLEAHVRTDVAQYALIAPPGKLYSYSNPGINIAGHIAEAVTGKPFAELMRELVFEPLEMRRTTLDRTVAMTYPLAQGHDVGEGGELRVRHQYLDSAAYAPSGGMLSTLLDFTNFARMQLNQGRLDGRPILSAQAVEVMRKVQAPYYTVPGMGYGLTVQIRRPGRTRRWMGHGGAIPGFMAQWVLLPDDGISLVVLANRYAPPQLDALAQQLVDVVAEPLPAESTPLAVVAPDQSLWPSFVGTYRREGVDEAMIQIDDDRLVLDWHGRKTVHAPLSALSRNHYAADATAGQPAAFIGFILEERGPVQYIMLNSRCCKRDEVTTQAGL